MSTDRRGRGETRYCSNCGDDLEPSMNYCPACGSRIRRQASGRTAPERSRGPRAETIANRTDTTRHGGPETRSMQRARATPRTPRTTGTRTITRRSGTETVDRASRSQLEAKIATATSDGWRLERDFGDHVVMVRRSFGTASEHLLVALVTIWWSMGIGNLLYGLYKYVEDGERLVLRPGLSDDADDEKSSGHLLARVTAATCLLAGALLAWIGIQLLGSVAGVVLGLLFGLALLFGATGVGVLPSVADRLERRHPVTTNGRTRSVEERSIVSSDRPCTACAAPVGRGLERIYRSEFALLGVPITGTAGRNCYCRQCANAERAPDAAERMGRNPGTRRTATNRTIDSTPNRAANPDRTLTAESHSEGSGDELESDPAD